MDYVKDIASYVSIFFFIVGLLSTVFNGSIKTVKITLSVLGIFFFLVALAGLIFSKGLLIFLIPQLIVLFILVFIVVIIGAATGVAIDKARRNHSAEIKLKTLDKTQYFPVAEFSQSVDVPEERIIQRIKSGFYKGGVHKGQWYINKAELPD